VADPVQGGPHGTASRTRPAGSNRLLAFLPPDEHERVSADLEQISLTQKQVLARPDEAYTHVLFPSVGVVSVLVPMGEEQSIEAAVIGFEGMVGVPIVRLTSTWA
jgi:hypothetical protein